MLTTWLEARELSDTTSNNMLTGLHSWRVDECLITSFQRGTDMASHVIGVMSLSVNFC